MDEQVIVRQARSDDRDGVVAFTRDTWPDRGSDYIPRVFDEWVETDGPRQRTLVAEADDEPVGICQGVLLSDHEAWGQGMRVHPDYRGSDVSRALSEAVFGWARRQGAAVFRSMIFSWNAAGLGHARSVGYEPVCEFRWVHPEPDPDPSATADGRGRTDSEAASAPDLEVLVDPDPAVAWSAFHGSRAYRELAGLGLDLEESWALSELSPDRLGEADRTLVVADGERTRGMTYRVRTFDREGDDGEEVRWAEYGVGAWDDHAALRALAAGVSRDAASVGAEEVRMLVPETPRHVSDAAYARLGLSDEPDFVLERDLTRC